MISNRQWHFFTSWWGVLCRVGSSLCLSLSTTTQQWCLSSHTDSLSLALASDSWQPPWGCTGIKADHRSRGRRDDILQGEAVHLQRGRWCHVHTNVIHWEQRGGGRVFMSVFRCYPEQSFTEIYPTLFLENRVQLIHLIDEPMHEKVSTDEFYIHVIIFSKYFSILKYCSD